MHLAFVCTGNICRSAAAERLTTAFAAEVGMVDLTASSSGTAAVVGYSMDPTTAGALLAVGGDPEGFRARQFEAGHALGADLVLTMTRAHRRTVLQAAPRAMHRTFTLLEASQLLGTLPDGAVPTAGSADAGRALVAALAGQRPARGPAGSEDDVLDPFGRSAQCHEAVVDQIADALFPLLQVLVGLRLDAVAPA